MMGSLKNYVTDRERGSGEQGALNVVTQRGVQTKPSDPGLEKKWESGQGTVRKRIRGRKERTSEGETRPKLSSHGPSASHLFQSRDPETHRPQPASSSAPDSCPEPLRGAGPASNRQTVAAFSSLGHRYRRGHRWRPSAPLLPFPKAGLPGAQEAGRGLKRKGFRRARRSGPAPSRLDL